MVLVIITQYLTWLFKGSLEIPVRCHVMVIFTQHHFNASTPEFPIQSRRNIVGVSQVKSLRAHLGGKGSSSNIHVTITSINVYTTSTRMNALQQ